MSEADSEIKDLVSLSEALLSLRDAIISFKRKNTRSLSRLHPEFHDSGVNFVHYLALRQVALKALQLRLAHFGLSSLGRCESHVLGNLQQVLLRVDDSIKARGRSSANKPLPKPIASLCWNDAEKILHRHSRDLFGPKPSRRHVYIMVTAPSREEFTEEWIKKVLRAGANLIRINCAHDDEAGWAEMTALTRKVSSDLLLPCRILMDLAGPKIRTAAAAPKPLSIGDRVFLVGKLRRKKKDILCSLPEVLGFLKAGERVLFDDGKIEARVLSREGKRAEIEIVRTPAPKTKLKAEKGINFPDSHLKIAEVTREDREALDFVAQHADLVGLSFVQSPATIRLIDREIRKRTKRRPGLVLKIETKAGFQALPRLLLEAMTHYPCGVMIARGDLGVEVGFERLVEVQEEILWLCEAAHVPVIWATQVLENEAKLGLPSRAEVTDAASSVRAECVMLNKGPFIENAVRSLDNILRRMELHTYKKRSLYRELTVARLN